MTKNSGLAVFWALSFHPHSWVVVMVILEKECCPILIRSRFFRNFILNSIAQAIIDGLQNCNRSSGCKVMAAHLPPPAAACHRVPGVIQHQERASLCPSLLLINEQHLLENDSQLEVKALEGKPSQPIDATHAEQTTVEDMQASKMGYQRGTAVGRRIAR